MSPPLRCTASAFHFGDRRRHRPSPGFCQALQTAAPLWPPLRRPGNELACGLHFIRANITVLLSQSATLIGHRALRRPVTADPHHGASWEFYKQLHIHEA
ncbi:hypothetical protein MDA_GLEAN10011716 [Myotis davidii]|uniref:Uncharacterized protein n=1 Tax=Myotis davidii TaxID=225400 RepID=L5MF43_MYODS|nr:hypothetical protein MDA_GLEAN10011716 [Myotis davidii]